jgi:hypothetical protein
MLGLGEGLGVWRELEPPLEWDELIPVIFFNAPENLRHMPFMLEEQERSRTTQIRLR